MTDPSHVTRLLQAASRGDSAASAELIEIVYQDLHRQAQALMHRERVNSVLQPTALVHEAFMHLIRQERVDWQGRSHFFAVAATSMRRILVDHARRRAAARRGGGAPKLSFDEGLGLTVESDADVLALHDALDRLAALNERSAQMVVMRFFGGLSVPEVAAVLGVSTRTVEGDWTMARTWLMRELTKG
jgi:RNA polymerase sigma factor (TIGR02999 family)